MLQAFTKFSFLVVFLSSAFLTMAQQNAPRQEIYAGYGFGTVQETQALFADIFGKNTETGKNGAVNFGYRYHVNNRWAIGVSGIIDNIKVTGNSATDNYTCKTFAVMADLQYYYVSKPIVQLYSGFYAGYGKFTTNKSTNENYSTVAFHATALGMRVGKAIGVFGEAGFGYRGVINAGISAKF